MTRSLLARRPAPPLRIRLVVAALLAATCLPLLAGAARADCQEDINKLMKKRLDAVAQINKAPKSAEGKLDPIAACPRLRSLASIEAEATAYMQKNKDWCNLPGDFVEKMSTSFSRTSTFASKACSVAVQIKKMQQQQAQQQQEAAPKLPAGPL